MAFIVILIMLALVVFYAIGIYNRLVTSRNNFRNSFAQIDVQLTRRNDLIPNLVETARGYLKHERETLEAVIAARNSAVAGLKAVAADPGNTAPVPVDLVTASGSGLDPHITPAAAAFQASRVAEARNLDRARVRELIAEHTTGRTFGLLGEPRVNVLTLNLALDNLALSSN